MASITDLGPASDHAAVSPDDSATFNPPFRSLYVGTAGDVNVTSLKGTDVVYKCPAGVTLFVAGTKVKSTSTTASDIVAMF